MDRSKQLDRRLCLPYYHRLVYMQVLAGFSWLPFSTHLLRKRRWRCSFAASWFNLRGHFCIIFVDGYVHTYFVHDAWVCISWHPVPNLCPPIAKDCLATVRFHFIGYFILKYEVKVFILKPNFLPFHGSMISLLHIAVASDESFTCS
jgi:hypothetical protein